MANGCHYFASFGRLHQLHHIIDTYSGFQWAIALSSEKASAVIQHLYECFNIMDLTHTIKTDNGPTYHSSSFQQFLYCLNIKYVTGIPYNSQGQATVEQSHHTLKTMLFKVKGGDRNPGMILSKPYSL